MKFLDTNVFIRFLTGDDENKARACLALFERLDSDGELATTSETIVAEVVYVLSSRSIYNLTADAIAQRLRPLLSIRGLRFPEKNICLRALEIFESYPTLDFEDALTVARVEHGDIDELVSYDRGFDQIPSIRRIEPITLDQ